MLPSLFGMETDQVPLLLLCQLHHLIETEPVRYGRPHQRIPIRRGHVHRFAGNVSDHFLCQKHEGRQDSPVHGFRFVKEEIQLV